MGRCIWILNVLSLWACQRLQLHTLQTGIVSTQDHFLSGTMRRKSGFSCTGVYFQFQGSVATGFSGTGKVRKIQIACFTCRRTILLDFAPELRTIFFDPNDWADLFKASGAK